MASAALPALALPRVAVAQPHPSARTPARRPLPAFTFGDAAGQAKTLADFPGKAFVMNFWATWCPPCVEEMPSLDRLHAALLPEGIHVLPLSIDRGGIAQVEAFYRSHGLDHLAIWTDRRSEAARALGVHGLPTTIVTDRAGFEVARVEGPVHWDLPAIAIEIRRLAGTAEPG